MRRPAGEDGPGGGLRGVPPVAPARPQQSRGPAQPVAASRGGPRGRRRLPPNRAGAQRHRANAMSACRTRRPETSSADRYPSEPRRERDSVESAEWNVIMPTRETLAPRPVPNTRSKKLFWDAVRRQWSAANRKHDLLGPAPVLAFFRLSKLLLSFVSPAPIRRRRCRNIP